MRRILSEEELNAKQSRRNKWISFFILAMMVFGTAGAAFVYNSESSGSTGNNGAKVQQNGNYWQANFGGANLNFLNSPESSLNNTNFALIANFNQFYNKTLYIASGDSSAYSEIASSLGLFSLRVQQACYQNCSNSQYVQKDCTNNVIVYTPSETRSITGNQSCVFINGDLATVDGFLYKTFGLA
ncbi:MAG: hypothetical protein WCK29_01685 [archaeon]